MTTAHEPRRAPGVHLSAEELSEAAEERQEGAAGAAGHTQDVAEHLRDCRECRAEVDALADLLRALADLDPLALPPEVALRIDAALADAALADTAPVGTASIGTSLTDTARADIAQAEKVAPREGAPAAPADTSAPSRSRRRPLSPLPRTSRPASRRSPARRPLRRGAEWALASLTVLAGLIGLTALVISSGHSNSGASSTSAGAPAQNPGVLQKGLTTGDASSRALLASWTRTALSAVSSSSAPDAAGSGSHANALNPGLLSSADSGLITACLANPAFTGYQVLATSYGEFDGKPSVLVVYANGDGSQAVYAVAYQAPCASPDYHVLAAGTVPR